MVPRDGGGGGWRRRCKDQSAPPKLLSLVHVYLRSRGDGDRLMAVAFPRERNGEVWREKEQRRERERRAGGGLKGLPEPLLELGRDLQSGLLGFGEREKRRREKEMRLVRWHLSGGWF